MGRRAKKRRAGRLRLAAVILSSALIVVAGVSTTIATARQQRHGGVGVGFARGSGSDAKADGVVEEDGVSEKGGAGTVPGSPREQQYFRAAAREFEVPESVLLGVSYQQSQWESHQGEYNTMGGYGPMSLTDVTPAMALQARLPSAPSLHTLPAAAELTGASEDRVRTDPRENIRAGAALLASYEKKLTGGTPSAPADWYGAVAQFSGSPDEKAAGSFAGHVFDEIRAGARRTTEDGQGIRLRAQPSVRPRTGQLAGLRLAKTDSAGTECPADMDCRFEAAAPTNRQVADRPADGLDIRYVVIHDAESSYADAIAGARASGSGNAANYVMRALDGAVTQTVADKNLAFHANNYWFIMHSVGIEHEGFAAHGATWYTQAQYQSTADLVKYLAHQYGIPLDREHVLGHDSVAGPTDAYVAGMHWDPGPYWDWDRFMALLGAPTDEGRHGVGAVGSAVTIAPHFAANKQDVTVCPIDDPTTDSTGCAGSTAPADVVYLRTAPSSSASLVNDPYVHSSGAPGTHEISDWGSTAQSGQQFVVAARKGDWTAIWFGGRQAWFDNPDGKFTIPAKNVKILEPAGKDEVPVLGEAFPAPSEYPAGLGPDRADPLSRYSFRSGQAYVATRPPVHRDAFFPAGDSYVRGAGEVYTIQYNHRVALVDASHVTAR